VDDVKLTAKSEEDLSKKVKIVKMAQKWITDYKNVP
jgi:hypothetical protein